MSSRRNAVLVLSVMAAVVLGAGVAGAGEADLSGDWVMTMEGDSPTGEATVAMTFAVEGHQLAATMTGKTGAVVSEGYVDGNRIRFYYIRQTDEGRFVATFSGHVAGDLMGGEVDLGDSGSSQWRATRGPSQGVDLAGDWKLTMEGDSPTGEESVVVRFDQDGPSLTATIVGDQGEVECEGFQSGNAIRFYYTRPTDEGQFVAMYSGHVAGDLMGGEVDMGEMGKVSWRAERQN